jgi:hypothetical protein
MMADETEKEYLHSMFETLVHWYEVREMTLIDLWQSDARARLVAALQGGSQGLR